MSRLEQHLRDAVASNLELVEPGMVFLETEYQLTSSVGARGRVDIFARDALGMFTIIEIKRSENTAREAIHELLKYAELIEREQGLETHQLRLVLISTTWHELTVPFSAFQKMSPYPLVGLRAHLDAEGALVALSELPGLPLVGRGRLFRSNVALSFRSEPNWSPVWQQVLHCLAGYGIEDVLGLQGSWAGDWMSPYAHVLFVAFGRAIHQPSVRTDTADRDREPWALERKAMRALLDRVACDESEAGSPEAIASVIPSTWDIRAVHRAGAFALQRHTPDEELIELASGFGGQNRVTYRAEARPRTTTAWHELAVRANLALADCPVWEPVLNAWLDERAAKEPDLPVRVYVFHPKNIVLGLAYLLWHGNRDRLSYMQALQRRAGEPIREIHGLLTWSGDGEPIDTVIEDVFGPLDRFAVTQRVTGTLAHEEEVMRRVGLRFAVIEMDDEDQLWWLTRSDQGLRRAPAENPHASLQRFFNVQQVPLLTTASALHNTMIGGM
jgi:hypothetical protein